MSLNGDQSQGHPTTQLKSILLPESMFTMAVLTGIGSYIRKTQLHRSITFRCPVAVIRHPTLFRVGLYLRMAFSVIIQMIMLRKTFEQEDLSRYLRGCLLYTSDAADDLLCVDLGGR